MGQPTHFFDVKDAGGQKLLNVNQVDAYIKSALSRVVALRSRRLGVLRVCSFAGWRNRYRFPTVDRAIPN